MDSFSSLQQWLTKVQPLSLLPTEELVGERLEPCSGWGFCLPISLSPTLSHTDSGWKSLSQPLKRWGVFLEVKMKVLRGGGKETNIPIWRSWSKREFFHRFQLPEWRELRGDEVSTLQARKNPSHPVSCKQKDLWRFRKFFYYLNSLLCVCFLYWQHFLSWESVICWKERQRKGKRGGGSRDGEGRGKDRD